MFQSNTLFRSDFSYLQNGALYDTGAFLQTICLNLNIKYKEILLILEINLIQVIWIKLSIQLLLIMNTFFKIWNCLGGTRRENIFPPSYRAENNVLFFFQINLYQIISHISILRLNQQALISKTLLRIHFDLNELT